MSKQIKFKCLTTTWRMKRQYSQRCWLRRFKTIKE